MNYGPIISARHDMHNAVGAAPQSADQLGRFRVYDNMQITDPSLRKRGRYNRCCIGHKIVFMFSWTAGDF